MHCNNKIYSILITISSNHNGMLKKQFIFMILWFSEMLELVSNIDVVLYFSLETFAPLHWFSTMKLPIVRHIY